MLDCLAAATFPRGRQGAAAPVWKKGMLLPWGRGKTSVISFLGVL